MIEAFASPRSLHLSANMPLMGAPMWHAASIRSREGNTMSRSGGRSLTTCFLSRWLVHLLASIVYSGCWYLMICVLQTWNRMIPCSCYLYQDQLVSWSNSTSQVITSRTYTRLKSIDLVVANSSNVQLVQVGSELYHWNPMKSFEQVWNLYRILSQRFKKLRVVTHVTSCLGFATG